MSISGFALRLLLPLAVAVGLLVGCTPGTLQVEKPCENSPWFAASVGESQALVPSGNPSTVKNPLCTADGGEFDRGFYSSSSYQSVYDQFARQGAAQGWVKVGQSECMSKTISGLPTYAFLSGSGDAGQHSITVAAGKHARSDCAG